MVKYIQCKHCYDEDPTCKQCDGSGYMASRTIKDRLREILHIVFPCLKEKEQKYKKLPTETHFYDDLFTMMSEMEETSLIDERENVIFDNQNEMHRVETDLKDDLDTDPEIDDDNKQITPDTSCLIEEEKKLVRKIEIPKNGVSPDTMPDNIKDILENYSF